MIAEPRLEIDGLRQRLYDRARGEEFVVYVDQNITLCAGDFVALLGPSGCGKTTLLSVLGLLRAPTDPAALKRFSIWAPQGGNEAKELDLKQAWQRRQHRLIEKARRSHLGFALQSGELLTSLTVHENIAAPLRLNGAPRGRVTQRVDELIDAFRLRRRLTTAGAAPSSGDPDAASEAGDGHERYSSLGSARINRLSGGEYQRVALARAIAHRPTIVFVDEPTSALNRELARGSLELLKNLQSSHRQDGLAGVTVMITHDEEFAADFSNVIIRMAPRRHEPAGEVVDVTRLDQPGDSPASD
jgi:putative ABC transport system ATP-binding protein